MNDLAIKIDGIAISSDMLGVLKDRISHLKESHNLIPSIAMLLVGDNEASKIYVKIKAKKCLELGIKSQIYSFNSNVSTSEVIEVIDSLNQDINVNGILLQLPLPGNFNTFDLLSRIAYQKDVDCLAPYNVGLLNLWLPYLEPCTPQGIMILIKKILGNDVSGKKAVVIGRSIIVGRPIAAMLLRENCTVSVLHSYSKNLVEECKNADILVVATGQSLLVKKDWIKDGACVIDVGISKIDGKIYGDVDFDDVRSRRCYITPVPGGVGPMTIACLLYNTVKAACIQNGITLD